MKYIAKIVFLLSITYFVLAAPKSRYYTQKKTEEDRRNQKHIQDSLNGLLCPPFGLFNNFEVSTIQTATPMYGCAYLETDNKRPNPAPLFHLWLERPEPTLVHGHCNDMQNMDHLIFECLSKDNPTNIMNIEKGWKYISLLDHSKNETKKISYRCAVYDVQDNNSDGVRIIRIAISKAVNEILDLKQCEGLGNILGEDALPFVAEGQREWPDGFLYLYMIGKNMAKGNK